MPRQSEQSPETTMLLEIVHVLRAEPEYEIAARRIEEIERQHMTAVAADKQLALRRSAARMAFIAATDKDASFEEVSARFHRMCELGFSSSHSELAVLVEFADACVSLSHRNKGLRVLAQARERLLESDLKSPSAVSAVIEGCRQRLEDRPAAEPDAGPERGGK